jgi:hypothetical protein
MNEKNKNKKFSTGVELHPLLKRKDLPKKGFTSPNPVTSEATPLGDSFPAVSFKGGLFNLYRGMGGVISLPLTPKGVRSRVAFPSKEGGKKGLSLESSHWKGGTPFSLPPVGARVASPVPEYERSEKVMENLCRGMGEGVQRRTHLGGIGSRNSLHRFRYRETDRFILGIRGKLIVNRLFSYQKSSLQSLLFAASLLQKGGRLLVVDTRGDLYSLLTLYTRTDPSSQKRYNLPSHLSSSGERWVGGTLTNWADISKKIYQFGDISQKISSSTRTPNPSFASIGGGSKGGAGNAPPSGVPPLRRYEKRGSAYPGFLEFTNVIKEEFTPPTPNSLGLKKGVRRELRVTGKSPFDSRELGEGVKLRFQRKPDALFLVNPSRNKGVIAEAAFLKIPVIGFLDSETDPKGITYPIPLNIYSFKETFFFLLTLLRLAGSMESSGGLEKGDPKRGF